MNQPDSDDIADRRVPVAITLSPMAGPGTKVVVAGVDIAIGLKSLTIKVNAGAPIECELGLAPGHAMNIVADLAVAGINVTGLIHAVHVAMAPWTQHHSDCDRVTRAGDCSCGLQRALEAGVEARL